MGQAPVAGTRGVRERRRLVVGVGLVINGVVATALDWRIVAIDGIPTRGQSLKQAVDTMRGEVDSPVEVTIRQTGAFSGMASTSAMSPVFVAVAQLSTTAS